MLIIKEIRKKQKTVIAKKVAKKKQMNTMKITKNGWKSKSEINIEKYLITKRI